MIAHDNMIACDEMLACNNREAWNNFLTFIKEKTSATAFSNWLSPIVVIDDTEGEITLEVPNIFVQEYLLSNYKQDLCAFLPVNADGLPAIKFVIAQSKGKQTFSKTESALSLPIISHPSSNAYALKLNPNYRFETFIEGATNQFVKSAAMGVASRPGMSYNPLFIHGPVGLGKTHMLHSIGHYVGEHHKKLKVQCITTEAFINELVDNLRSKSVDKMKRFYRSDVDILLVDDIQFLQNRLNFEEEFSNTFETLINQNKQIVITSDKPPSQLKLSERIVARMEWGLVAHVGVPELETRVAILQHKAQQKGLDIPSNVAFFIAEHIYNNVRQLEGAVNRLSAQSRLLNLKITEELVQRTLSEMLQKAPHEKISLDNILKCVATVFQVRVSDIKGSARTKDIALPRHVAMYLAWKWINESLQMLGASFGKTHSTILHACKNIEKKIEGDETLRKQIQMVERNIRH